jgi:hypothetical protein
VAVNNLMMRSVFKPPLYCELQSDGSWVVWLDRGNP